jgi:phosphoribosylamine--glycine ligase
MNGLVMPTRILILGRGGREHALAWKLASEPGVNRVFVGDDAMAELPRTTRVGPDDFLQLARRFAVELVVIGPEAHLANGVADELVAAGVPTFGPTSRATRIESSKGFCRDVAEAAGVPMASGRFIDRMDEAIAFAREVADLPGSRGAVVKEDGLAAGKGVFVCETADEAEAAVVAIFGDTSPVVIEERLVGREASVIALCDGREAVALPAARDHKRLLDGDAGPNTGGMGAYSPLPDLDDDSLEAIVDQFHRPVLAELARRGTPFRGALYAGLMLTAEGPRLLEFNARFGDPETQVILPRLAGPLGPWLLAAARGALPDAPGGRLPVLPGGAVGIVLAAADYPTARSHGARIEGIAAAEAAGGLVFHGGTRRGSDGAWETDGGRVLTVVGHGPDLAAARATAERAADLIRWPGMHRRHDIGADLPTAATAGVAG